MREFKQMFMVFVIASGTALAMLEGAKRFGEESSLYRGLRWGALGVLILGCAAVGLSLMVGAVSDLRRVFSPVTTRPQAHRQASRGGAVFRLLLGIVMGVVVPAVLLVAASL